MFSHRVATPPRRRLRVALFRRGPFVLETAGAGIATPWSDARHARGPRCAGDRTLAVAPPDRRGENRREAHPDDEGNARAGRGRSTLRTSCTRTALVARSPPTAAVLSGKFRPPKKRRLQPPVPITFPRSRASACDRAADGGLRNRRYASYAMPLSMPIQATGIATSGGWIAGLRNRRDHSKTRGWSGDGVDDRLTIDKVLTARTMIRDGLSKHISDGRVWRSAEARIAVGTHGASPKRTRSVIRLVRPRDWNPYSRVVGAARIRNLRRKGMTSCGRRRRAMPVTVSRRAPDDFTGPDLHDRLAFAWHPAAADVDDQRRSERMRRHGSGTIAGRSPAVGELAALPIR